MLPLRITVVFSCTTTIFTRKELVSPYASPPMGNSDEPISLLPLKESDVVDVPLPFSSYPFSPLVEESSKSPVLDFRWKVSHKSVDKGEVVIRRLTNRFEW